MKWDDYLEKDSDVLKNKFSIKDDTELTRVEKLKTDESINNIIKDNKPIEASYQGYQDLHRQIFGDVYPDIIAGATRQVDMAKSEPLLDGATVHYAPANMIESYANQQIQKMNGVDFKKDETNALSQFAEAATELWVAHPFREGNTRTHMVFIAKLAMQKGYSLDISALNKNKNYRDSLVAAYGSGFLLLGKILKASNTQSIK